MQNGIFDETLTTGLIGGEHYSWFSHPVVSALVFFKFTFILRAFNC